MNTYGRIPNWGIVSEPCDLQHRLKTRSSGMTTSFCDRPGRSMGRFSRAFSLSQNRYEKDWYERAFLWCSNYPRRLRPNGSSYRSQIHKRPNHGSRNDEPECAIPIACQSFCRRNDSVDAMTGTKDTAAMVSSQTAESRLMVYKSLPNSIDKYELVLDNAEHSAFWRKSLARRQ